MSVIRRSDQIVINKMLSLTEVRVNDYKSRLEVGNVGVVPGAKYTLEALVVTGSKLVDYYELLLDKCDVLDSEEYNFIANEILRTEKNFMTLQKTLMRFEATNSSASSQSASVRN